MRKKLYLSSLRVLMLGVLAMPIVSCDEEIGTNEPDDELVEVGVIECADSNHAHAIDLGLSVKWACCNVGAESPEDYGGYYAWGETEEKSDYTLDNYKYHNSNTGFFNIGSNISGTSYDVAHVKWGGSWRMPTWDEIKELFDKCSWKWIEINGIKGQKVTGPNGNSIFLPASGCSYDMEVDDSGWYGFYWSGTIDDIYCGCDHNHNQYYLHSRAFNFWFGYNITPQGTNPDRYLGYTVRPVTE